MVSILGQLVTELNRPCRRCPQNRRKRQFRHAKLYLFHIYLESISNAIRRRIGLRRQQGFNFRPQLSTFRTRLIN